MKPGDGGFILILSKFVMPGLDPDISSPASFKGAAGPEMVGPAAGAGREGRRVPQGLGLLAWRYSTTSVGLSVTAVAMLWMLGEVARTILWICSNCAGVALPLIRTVVLSRS